MFQGNRHFHSGEQQPSGEDASNGSQRPGAAANPHMYPPSKRRDGSSTAPSRQDPDPSDRPLSIRSLLNNIAAGDDNASVGDSGVYGQRHHYGGGDGAGWRGWQAHRSPSLPSLVGAMVAATEPGRASQHPFSPSEQHSSGAAERGLLARADKLATAPPPRAAWAEGSGHHRLQFVGDRPNAASQAAFSSAMATYSSAPPAAAAAAHQTHTPPRSGNLALLASAPLPIANEPSNKAEHRIGNPLYSGSKQYTGYVQSPASYSSITAAGDSRAPVHAPPHRHEHHYHQGQGQGHQGQGQGQGHQGQGHQGQGHQGQSHQGQSQSQHVIRSPAEYHGSADVRFHPYPEIQQQSSSAPFVLRPYYPPPAAGDSSHSQHPAHAAHMMADAGAPAAMPPAKSSCAAAATSKPEQQQQQQQQLSRSLSTGDRRSRRAKDAAAQRRRRRTQACEYCHLKKIKCVGDGVRCINCIKNDVQCTWGQKRKRGPKPKLAAPSLLGGAPMHAFMPAAAASTHEPLVSMPTVVVPSGRDSEYLLGGQGERPVSPASDDAPDDESTGMDFAPSPRSSAEGLRAPRMDREMEEFFSDRVDAETRDAVVYYFDYFYPLAPMFHPSMFIRRVVAGDVDPLLLDAMKATTARVIATKTGRSIDGQELARSVKSRILAQLERPSADLVRVLVVMTLLAGSQGEYVSYNSLICLAASLVVRLGWHQLDLYKRAPERSWDDWVAVEVRRRIFWLVYQTDSYQAMLTGRPMSIAEDSVYVSAPCSDYEWDVILRPSRLVPAADPRQQGSKIIDRLVQTTRHQRSSRSSSGSATSLVQSLRVDQHTIVATGAFSYSFMALCELTAIIARINIFLCDAKTGRPSILLPPEPALASGSSSSAATSGSRGMFTGSAFARDGPFPAVDFLGPAPVAGSLVHPVLRTVALPSEYPTFLELDERLEEWKRSLLLPEELRDEATEAADITYFGTADHRRFMMRVRYFCLHCYYVPITLFLHQSNRPSFFTEYEQPLEQRLRNGQLLGNEYSASPPPFDEKAAREHGNPPEPLAESDVALREMLNSAFASTWNEGLLAYDIEARSWQISVQAAHGLSEHLERNSDLPLERFDQVIPFCIFMSIAVLIRQVRMCNRQLEQMAQAHGHGTSEGYYGRVETERTLCVRHAKHQWEIMQKLGALWNVEGMELLLKSMQIDEVTNAADMFSGMSL
ncbi:hypothetical protein GGI25_005250 [Coemansia spiralis]|uniref:Zn(2)-C6 fungal-type domain-containing protein n=1 Tax=Coemansia spiralis TaxID=417178 RepID=A0A9W8G3K1_9FUNG|nr:hypothetical protein GGI25_005250 [Coemansia spiralis]